MRLRTFFFTSLVGVLLLAGATPLLAEDALALVVERRGKVYLEHEGKRTPARRHSLVAAGDRIEVEPGGSLTIQFSDGVICRVGPDSLVEVEKLLERKREQEIRLRVKRGSVAASVESARKTQRLQIVSLAAIASVRGTAFLVEADENETNVLVGEGSVAVKPGEKSKGRSVTVAAGEKAVCDAAEIRKAILERHEQKKLAIIDRFKKRKERFFERLIEQKRSDRERLERQKNRL